MTKTTVALIFRSVNVEYHGATLLRSHSIVNLEIFAMFFIDVKKCIATIRPYILMLDTFNCMQSFLNPQ